MKVKDLYTKFRIPPNLQQHMLRVAAICKIILNKPQANLDNENIINSALVHDLGNIIKFDFDNYPDVGDTEHNTDYWKGVQSEFKEKYGKDEHQATIKILKEIGFNEKLIEIVEKSDWPILFTNNKINDHTILIYADMLVTPTSITTIENRLNNLIERDAARGRSTDMYIKLLPIALKLEKELSKTLNLTNINSNKISSLFDELLDTEIIN